jgi:hypothetical protein
MTSQELSDAIFHIAPDAEFSFTETDLDSLKWYSKDIEKPSVEAILAAVPLAKTKFEAAQKELQAEKQALLERLGITAEEAQLLLN